MNAAKADAAQAATSTSTGCEAEFVALADALHKRTDTAATDAARGALLAALGGDVNKLVDSVCVMAFFNGLADRIADASGLQVESNRVQASLHFADKHLLSASTSPLTQGGRFIITVAGFRACPFHVKALSTARGMVSEGNGKAVEELTFDTRDEYQAWLRGRDGRVRFSTLKKAAGHTSSPFVYMTAVNHSQGTFIGGCDDLVALARMMRAQQPVSGAAAASKL